jgi:hypothetical protein
MIFDWALFYECIIYFILFIFLRVIVFGQLLDEPFGGMRVD